VDAPEPTPLEFDGATIQLLRAGSGEPLLFLHPAGGAGQWRPYHSLFADHFDVIAPDGPGFGQSDAIEAIEGIDDLVYFTLELLDRLGLERPNVVGASFGGWLAAELAVHSPHRVGRLVLVDAIGLDLPDHPYADLFAMTREETIAALFHDASVGERVFPPDPEIDVLVQDYKDKTAFATVAWSPFMCNPKLERRLRRISAPTLVLWGADDRVVPVKHGERYAELISDATLAVLPGCGHAALVEQTEQAVAAIVEFLGRGAS
jgi:pimeloyl-ACP methyl ester carboxylesterase